MNSLANLEERRKRVQERLDQRWQPERINPVMEPANIRYEVSSRVSATDAGGLGLMRSVVQCLGIAELIDDRLALLKRYRSFHESGHVLSLAYNMMCGEATLAGLSARREDEAFLDALSARRIPHLVYRLLDVVGSLDIRSVSHSIEAKDARGTRPHTARGSRNRVGSHRVQAQADAGFEVGRESRCHGRQEERRARR